MRNPNGYGSITKLSGKRRKPYMVRVSEWVDVPTSSPLDAPSKLVQKPIGYFASRQEAMMCLAEYNKNPFEIRNADITFKELYDLLYKAEIEQAGNKGAYITSFKKCEPLHNIKFRSIKTWQMQEIIDAYSHQSKGSQKAIVILCHKMYKFAIERDVVDKDYSRFLKLTSTQFEKPKGTFAPEEVGVLWKSDSWISEIVLMLLYTGARVGELLSLKSKDVELDKRIIHLHGTKTENAERLVPIHKDIIPLLEKRVVNTYICEKDGKPMKYNYFQPRFAQVVDNHTIHEARHTFISVAQSCGFNPVLLRKIVGHSSADITEQVYTHAFIDDLVAEIDKFHF